MKAKYETVNIQFIATQDEDVIRTSGIENELPDQNLYP